MNDEIARFDADLRALIRQSETPIASLEATAMKALQQKLCIRVCTALLDDLEAERNRLFDRLANELQIGVAPPAPHAVDYRQVSPDWFTSYGQRN